MNMLISPSLILTVLLVSLSTIPFVDTKFLSYASGFADTQPRTLVVDPNATGTVEGLFQTIQAAINNATPGDTIFVLNGTYLEDIIVNKTLSMIGQDRNGVTITGLSRDAIVDITADSVVFTNFTVTATTPGQTGAGIRVNSRGGLVDHDTVSATYVGMILSAASNTSIIDNLVQMSHDAGIVSYLSNNNTLSDNMITENPVGIRLSYSNDNLFSANTMRNNTLGLATSLYDANNTFFHNNFFDPVVISADVGVWDNNNQGNYWSGYTGTDQNNDGIGDEPFTIPGTTYVDHYPLTGMYFGFQVVLMQESFLVGVISNSSISKFGFEIGTETGNRIMHFDVSSASFADHGFSRVSVPIGLMNDSFVVLSGKDEIVPTMLNDTDPVNTHFIFTYPIGNQTITVIASETLNMYRELLSELERTRLELDSLNSTYNDLLRSYTSRLEAAIYGLSQNYIGLSMNYTDLLQNYTDLNYDYQQHLSDFSVGLENMRNLTYILAVVSMVFIVTTIYLSKNLYRSEAKENSSGQVLAERQRSQERS